MSTQPSTRRRTVKGVPAFGLDDNNKWRWWMRTAEAFTGGCTACVRVGGHQLLSLHFSSELSELSQRLYLDISIVN